MTEQQDKLWREYRNRILKERAEICIKNQNVTIFKKSFWENILKEINNN